MTGALPLWPSVSDGDLARSAAGGDRAAFAEIYDRYADRLYDYCVGLLGDRDAAADCVHDAFCVAATDLGNLREPDKLRPWLYSIVRNHAMRRLRGRYREEVSESVPDLASADIGPDTLAAQSELARLVADAAGGLSDRDRELLELSYRHGLDGPELAEALGVTLTNANTMVFRLRQTVERCLGALLVARAARANRHGCSEMAAVLADWDGQFTVLMRKRIGRHIDSCPACKQEQRRRVNPVALLGGATVFISAPHWLRDRTLNDVQLTSVSSAAPGRAVRPPRNRRLGAQAGLLVGIPMVCLGIVWFVHNDTPDAPRIDDVTDFSSVNTGAVTRAPTVAPSVPAPTPGVVSTTVPTRQASVTQVPRQEPSVPTTEPQSSPVSTTAEVSDPPPVPVSPIPPPPIPPSPAPPAAPPPGSDTPQGTGDTPPWPQNGTSADPGSNGTPPNQITPPWTQGTPQWPQVPAYPNPNGTSPQNLNPDGSPPFPQASVAAPAQSPQVAPPQTGNGGCIPTASGCFQTSG